MAYCRYCGAEIRSTDPYCFKCGRLLEIQSTNSSPIITEAETTISTIDTVIDAKVKRMNVIIDPTRLIVVTILSFGLYLYYWFYLTWKHYRDYTKKEAYPVWHALTICVPIYCWFRVHAHIRSYKELMAEVGLVSNLNPGLFIFLFMVCNFIAILGWRLVDSMPSVNIVLSFVSVGLTVGMLIWVQSNLNRYWRSIKTINAVNARVGVGEVIFGLIGVLAWIGTFFPEV